MPKAEAFASAVVVPLLGGVLGGFPLCADGVSLAFLHVVHCHLGNLSGNVEQVAQGLGKLFSGHVADFIVVTDGVGGGVLHGVDLFSVFCVPLGTVFIIYLTGKNVNTFFDFFEIFFRLKKSPK